MFNLVRPVAAAATKFLKVRSTLHFDLWFSSTVLAVKIAHSEFSCTTLKSQMLATTSLSPPSSCRRKCILWALPGLLSSLSISSHGKKNRKGNLSDNLGPHSRTLQKCLQFPNNHDERLKCLPWKQRTSTCCHLSWHIEIFQYLD